MELQVLRSGEIDLVVLESPKSCVQGELLAVRLKNIAARFPSCCFAIRWTKARRRSFS